MLVKKYSISILSCPLSVLYLVKKHGLLRVVLGSLTSPKPNCPPVDLFLPLSFLLFFVKRHCVIHLPSYLIHHTSRGLRDSLLNHASSCLTRRTRCSRRRNIWAATRSTVSPKLIRPFTERKCVREIRHACAAVATRRKVEQSSRGCAFLNRSCCCILVATAA